MRHIYFAPSPALKGLLSYYYLLEVPGGFRTTVRAELPNARFILDGRAEARFSDGLVFDDPGAVLAGPTTRAFEIIARGRLTVFGAGVLPCGWRTLFGVDAVDVADRYVPLCVLAPPAQVSETVSRMREAADPADLPQLADAFFTSLADASRWRPCSNLAAVEAWLLDPTNLALDALIDRLNVSTRQAGRITQRYFGAPPKVLQRKYRALHAAVRMSRTGVADWGDCAAADFYDQSYFIKEFKAFVGVTPHKFLADQRSLSAMSIQRRRGGEEDGRPKFLF